MADMTEARMRGEARRIAAKMLAADRRFWEADMQAASVQLVECARELLGAVERGDRRGAELAAQRMGAADVELGRLWVAEPGRAPRAAPALELGPRGVARDITGPPALA